MLRHAIQAALAVLVWSVLLAFSGVPLVLAVLIPVDIALLGLAALAWRAVRT